MQRITVMTLHEFQTYYFMMEEYLQFVYIRSIFAH